ncbi:MAG: hypothetical protein H6Q20_1097 [Bacteroidetes bacterium]|nr:hypothetical protein [Bacteroidota bacterium]
MNFAAFVNLIYRISQLKFRKDGILCMSKNYNGD